MFRVSGVRTVHVRAGVAAASDGNDDAAGSDGSDATAASRYAIPHDPADHPGLPEMFEGERWEILATETEAESSEGDSEEHIGEVNIDLMATRCAARLCHTTGVVPPQCVYLRD